MLSQSQQKFMKLFDVPDFMAGHLDLLFSKADIDFVNSFGRDKITITQAMAKLDYSETEAKKILEYAYANYFLNKEMIDGECFYSLGNFYWKYEFESKYNENFLAIDNGLRQKVSNWIYERYKVDAYDYFNDMRTGKSGAKEIFLSFDEIEEYFNTTKYLRVFKCSCRMMAENCDKPRETCIAADDAVSDRTYGRVISKEEAIEITKDARKKGLMQSVSPNWKQGGGSGWICNCCGDCCSPLLIEQEWGITARRTQVAVRDETKCIHCGICIARCNFSAFAYSGEDVLINGKMRREISFDPEKCWGCTICLDTCKPGALSIVKK